MKKLVLGLTMALTLTAAAPSYATFGSFHKHTGFYKIHLLFPFLCDHKVKPTKPEKPTKPTRPTPTTPVKSVPEIDAAGAGLALAFVGGILAIRRERRKLEK